MQTKVCQWEQVKLSFRGGEGGLQKWMFTDFIALQLNQTPNHVKMGFLNFFSFEDRCFCRDVFSSSFGMQNFHRKCSISKCCHVFLRSTFQIDIVFTDCVNDFMTTKSISMSLFEESFFETLQSLKSQF